MSSTSNVTNFSRSTAHAISYSCSSGEPIYSGYTSNEDREGFYQGSQRAGGPYLCSLPCESEALGPQFDVKSFNKIITEVSRMVEYQEIPFVNITVTGRRSRVSPGAQPIPTILIISDGRKKSRMWKRLTKSIFKSIIWNCTFSVEIIDATL
ncbi:uncharacterized protein ASPGLDRAFT_42440 [Aspergillus glaucus CBS 516.65]|uniref:Uncharacterized protein n=1 Tax=Aspergillus glaucus CBS 516.65 TaxID=1160497 RepID=A0A1L9VY73_ASPGL|nr:hypothetical protein ASPGLDRAFT_42440 [Aspergillus glaucus CBS 516.65]OJJ88845.1 hypothetical protein ASPGLDRAFT_42440 [Aspergillus glaucus CBS 516.65]